jgi:hypothetical protein
MILALHIGQPVILVIGHVVIPVHVVKMISGQAVNLTIRYIMSLIVGLVIRQVMRQVKRAAQELEECISGNTGSAGNTGNS